MKKPIHLNREEAEVELNDAQLERIDLMYNSVYDTCNVFAEKEIDWDMEVIGEITDFIINTLYTKQGINTRYPGVVTHENGTQTIEEYAYEEK